MAVGAGAQREPPALLVSLCELGCETSEKGRGERKRRKEMWSFHVAAKVVFVQLENTGK
jgi:hypothetical protein